MIKIITPEKLSTASVSRGECIRCGLHEDCKNPFLKPYVPETWTKRFLIVGEAPFKVQALRFVCQPYGIKQADLAFVPVLRCPTKKPSMKQIRACLPFLYRVVQQLDPQVIVGMGKVATKALLNRANIGSVRGLAGRRNVVQVEGKDYAVYFTSGLSEARSDPNQALFMAEDFRRLTLVPTKLPENKTPSDSKYIGCDTEFSPDKVLCGAFSSGTKSITLTSSQLSHCQALVEDSILVGHNLPVDLDSLLRVNMPGLRRALDVWLQGKKVRDTLLVARLANENRGKDGYKLESLLLSQYNIEGWKKETEDLGPDPTKWPVHLMHERCRIDAWAALKVYEAFKDQALGPVQLSHQIAMTLQRVRHTGVYIDWKYFCKMKQKIYKETEAAEIAFTNYAVIHGLKDFCPTKDADIRELVYEKLGLEAESYTEGGLASTSVKKLKEYENDYPEIKALISYSKAEKLRSTYCDSLEKCFVRLKDGLWMPVNINPLAAKTGRRSSNKPNMQNLPTRIRKIVVSRFKDGSIADNDYSKLEPIIGGYVTGEQKLTDYFTKYPNGYIKIGEDFFKKSVEKNTPEYTMMKSLVLAIIYNKKKWSFAEDLWVTHNVKLAQDYERHVDEAGIILDRFLSKLFPLVREYHYKQEARVLDNGWVENALGQRRRLPLPAEPERSDKIRYKMYMRYKAHVINQAINNPIQSLAAYVVGSAMIDLERELLRQFNWTYYDYHRALLAKDWPQMPLLCIEVHDDLVQDIPRGMEKRTKQITHDVMTSVPTLRKLLPDFNVKLTVDTNIGERWGLKS